MFGTQKHIKALGTVASRAQHAILTPVRKQLLTPVVPDLLLTEGRGPCGGLGLAACLGTSAPVLPLVHDGALVLCVPLV